MPHGLKPFALIWGCVSSNGVDQLQSVYRKNKKQKQKKTKNKKTKIRSTKLFPTSLVHFVSLIITSSKTTRYLKKQRGRWLIMSSLLSDGSWYLLTIHLLNLPWQRLAISIACLITFLWSEAFCPNSSSLSFSLQLWFLLIQDEQGVEEIHLNLPLHLFKGLHKIDTPSGTEGDAVASTNDFTAAPTLGPSHATPDLSSPPPIDSSLVVHLYVEPRLLQDHAFLLAYLLHSNQDRQAFVTTALALLDFVVPVRPFPTPSVAGDST